MFFFFFFRIVALEIVDQFIGIHWKKTIKQCKSTKTFKGYWNQIYFLKTIDSFGLGVRV